MSGEVGLLGGITGLSQRVQGTAQANLFVLQWVDDVVDALGAIRRDADETRGMTEKFIAAIGETDGPILPEDEARDLILGAEEALKRLMARISSLAATTENSPVIVGEHEDSVLDDCCQAIAALSVLVGAFQELRWTLMEHNAEYEKPSEFYSDPREVLAP